MGESTDMPRFPRAICAGPSRLLSRAPPDRERQKSSPVAPSRSEQLPINHARGRTVLSLGARADGILMSARNEYVALLNVNWRICIERACAPDWRRARASFPRLGAFPDAPWQSGADDVIRRDDLIFNFPQELADQPRALICSRTAWRCSRTRWGFFLGSKAS